MTMEDVPFKVTTAAAEAMGKSAAELEAMTLGAFRKLAYYKGFDVRVSGFHRRTDGGRGSLTVQMDDERRPILHVG